MDISADLGKGQDQPWFVRKSKTVLGVIKYWGLQAYLNRGLQLEEDGLRNENLASLSAEITDLSLQQLDLLAWAAATDLKEAVDYGVQINFVLVRHCVYVSAPGGGKVCRRGRVRRKGRLRAIRPKDVWARSANCRLLRD